MRLVFITLYSLFLVFLYHPSLMAAGPESQPQFGNLPLHFIENQGQLDEEVAYYLQGSDKTLYFTSTGITFALNAMGEVPERWVVKLDFVNARTSMSPQGRSEQVARFNYFKGRPEEWQTGIPSYAMVVYEELWPGIDLVFKGTVNQLKYEFHVRPGADPKQIRLEYRGADRVSVQDSGALAIHTPLGAFQDGVPYAYQMIDEQPVPVSMHYCLDEPSAERTQAYGFRIGAYDPEKTLILDPVLFVYCGYIGGSSEEFATDIALDSDGNAYIVGATWSTEAEGFPVAVGPDLTHNQGVMDAFVVKVNPEGTGLVFSGYIGGGSIDAALSVALDGQNNVYVAGYTESAALDAFPITVGPDLSFGGLRDGFVAKVRADGSGLDYCGYIGGINEDRVCGIATDSQGFAYITGHTASTETDDFPLVVGPELIYAGGIHDAFVSKLKQDGSGFEFCGYIGGSQDDTGRAIAVDHRGNCYLTGETESNSSQRFPTKVGPDLTYNGGTMDAFVARVKKQGTGLVYCGYIGGGLFDSAWGIALDEAGAVYVAGFTDSTEADSFPVTVGPDLTYNGGSLDAFVAKVSETGQDLDFCGYIGGSEYDYAGAVELDIQGNAYVTGCTESSPAEGFPVVKGPSLTFNAEYDGFLAKLDPQGTELLYCGYIGGEFEDIPASLAVDDLGNAYVVGKTESVSQFPVTVGPDLSFNGTSWYDAFVAKISMALTASRTELSISGGTVKFTLHAGQNNAGRTYLLLGSFSGSDPGTPLPGGGETLPINWDSLTGYILERLGGPTFAGFLGQLDDNGRSIAAFNATMVHANKIGKVITFAFCLEGNPDWDFASNPVPVEFVP